MSVKFMESQMNIDEFFEEYNVPSHILQKILEKFKDCRLMTISLSEKIWQVVDDQMVTIIVCYSGIYHFNSSMYYEKEFSRVLDLLVFV